jgi:hypothetical protein
LAVNAHDDGAGVTSSVHQPAERRLPRAALLEPPPGYDIHYSAATANDNRGEINGESNASMFVYRDGVLVDLNRAIAQDAGGSWPRWRIAPFLAGF